MVNARSDFLNKGYYLHLADELLKFIDKSSLVLDCGCGEGYYTNYLEERLTEYNVNIYGTDISKIAVSKAAKRNKNKNITYFVSSLYDIPVASKSFDYILNICAPLCEKEFIRVLKENGKIIKVIPAKDHLIEMKEFLYKDVYLNDEEVTTEYLKEISRINVKNRVLIDNDDIKNLFMMTPYYYKTKKEDIERLYNLASLRITFSFEILVFEVKNV